MIQPVAVEARPGYRLWMRFSDGAEGEVDLSEFAGKGVFTRWDADPGFAAVSIGTHGAIMWGDDLDLCPDALYLRLTGKTPEDVFPNLREMGVHA